MVWPLVGLVLGLLCGRFFVDVSWWWWVWGAVVGGCVFFAGWVVRMLWLARGGGFVVMVFGGACVWCWWWGSGDERDVRWLLGEDEWVEVRGLVESLPQQRFSNPEELGRPERLKWLVRFVLRVEAVRRFGREWEGASGRVFVSSRMLEPTAVGFGDVVVVSGCVKRPAAAKNPGEFDARRYLEERRVFVEMRNEGRDVVVVVERSWWGDLRRATQVFRDYMGRALSLGLEGEEFAAAVLAGKIYGDRMGFTEEWNEKFRRTGTMHLFAVSGQNISVLAGVGLVVFWFFGMGRWRWAFLLVLPLCVYAAATGGQPSAIRAFVMAALLFFAWRLERPFAAVNVLCGACFLILCWDPGQLFDTGFQLSVGVMVALILLTPVIYRAFKDAANPCEMIPRVLWTEEEWRRIRRWRAVLGLMSASVAAFAGSLPLTWAHFHLVSWVGVLANFVVVPVAAVVVVIGALSLATAWFSPWLAVGFNNANWVLVNFITASVSFFSWLPFSSQYAGAASEWMAPQPRVCVLAVGEGFSAVTTGARGAEVLGGGSDYAMSAVTIPALKFFGVNRVRRHWLAGGSAPVTGGAEKLPVYFPVREYVQVGLPSRSWTLRRMRRSGRYVLRSVWAGDVLAERGYRWEVLWPERPESEEALGLMRPTSRGLVLRWVADGGRSVVFFVNADEGVFEDVYFSGRDLRGDVLVLGGGRIPQRMPEEILHEVNPKMVVLSSGGYMRAQLSPQLLRQLKERGIVLWDLEERGALELAGDKARPVRGFVK